MAAAKAQPHRLFFPAALVLAIILVPLKAAEVAGAAPPDLPLFWHGHEMLFGFAYAVVGGYLLTGRSRSVLLGAFAAWLAGRLVILGVELPPTIEAAAALAFPLLLSVLAATPFARAAKTIRNFAIAGILGAFAIAELLYQLGAAGFVAAGEGSGLILAADLVILLLFAMGGRIIAGATSGAHQAQGRKPADVAQAPLERWGLLLLMPMAVLDVLGIAAPASGALSGAAGLVILLRLVRWRPWPLTARPEVSLLHLGYLWLAVGLFAKAGAQLSGMWPLFEALHVALVGGFSLLALTMMMRTCLQRARRRIALPGVAVPTAILLSAAVALRGAAALPEVRLSLLWLSAVLWMAAMLLVLGWMIGFLLRRRARSAKLK